MDSLILLAQTPVAEPSAIDPLSLVLRIAHILAALILGGGIFYQRVVLLPTLAAQGISIESFLGQGRKRWMPWIGVTALLLIASGLYNFFKMNSAFELPKIYHPLFGVNFLLALGVFFISSVLAGRTSLAEKFRAKASFWLSLNLALVLAIVGIASFMRALDKPPKAVDLANPPAESAPADTE